eukprot:TRINITY_DN6871_c0_g1_i1.p1 TRINITY_DN6871_c0_g1~~TRINITY_DN6871_c0_g1_i1.p1  ORF type:complete len:747 (+),score=140.47 TRINITY_DN6871_c0_g1_i1:43-2283(+)
MRLATLLSAIVVVHCGLEVRIEPSGGYTVLVNGGQWLASGKTEFHEGGAWSSPEPIVHNPTQGADTLGSYNETTIAFTTNSYTVNGSIRQYNTRDLVSFTTHFITGMEQSNSSTSSNTTSSRFPVFKLNPVVGLNLGCLAWGGDFTNNNDEGPAIGPWPQVTSTGRSGGPHVIFNTATKDAIVLSHGSQFMAQSFESVDGSIASGVNGGVVSIPANFSVTTIISYSDTGVNNAATSWGAALLKLHGKTTVHRDSDPILKVLGYNTDHGAYYYYHPERNMTMGETVLAVYKQAQEQQIPYKYILLDSWWYFKGTQGGVTNWTAMPSVFPPGGNAALKDFTQRTGWMVIGHNRFWDHGTSYSVDNGGRFRFSDDGSEHYVVPLTQDFWDFLLTGGKEWGLTTYEQDWLFTEFNGVPYLQRSATMARDWLMQMGSAAADNGLTIQYCMPYARHVLQSVEIPVVTQVRTSGDYVPSNNEAPPNWNIGGSSILAHAVALAPFKDSFWTSTCEPGGSCGASLIPDVWRAAAIATLSNGPVTPADGVQYMNKPLIMRACMADGTLLRPSRPATYLDSYIYKRAGGTGPEGHVWSTYSTVDAERYDVVLSMVTAEYNLKPSELTLDRTVGVTGKSVFYSRNTTSFQGLVAVVLDPATGVIPLKAVPTSNDFDLVYIAPVKGNGWALLGELAKWVPVSAQRIASVAANGDSLSATVKGAPREEVVLTFYKTHPIEVHCTLPSTGHTVISSNGDCH